MSSLVFKQQAPKDVAELRLALESEDLDGLRQAAHRMKSASANLGATLLSRHCTELEATAADGNLSYAGIGRGSGSPEDAFLDFVHDGFRVMERGVANEVAGA